MKHLKSEIYKIICHNYFLFSVIVTFFYSCIAIYLYLLETSGTLMLFENFVIEFSFLYLVLSISFSSSIIADEYLYGTINDIKNIKVILSKIVILLLFIILIFLFSFLFTYDITLFLGHTNNVVNIVFLIIENFLKLLPMIIILNLVCILLSIITKKSNFAIIITFGLYIISGYLNNIIILKSLKWGYYLPIMIWNLNDINGVIPFCAALIFNLSYIFILVVIIIFMYLKRR